jgi:hypothetical protein
MHRNGAEFQIGFKIQIKFGHRNDHRSFTKLSDGVTGLQLQDKDRKAMRRKCKRWNPKPVVQDTSGRAWDLPSIGHPLSYPWYLRLRAEQGRRSVDFDFHTPNDLSSTESRNRLTLLLPPALPLISLHPLAPTKIASVTSSPINPACNLHVFIPSTNCFMLIVLYSVLIFFNIILFTVVLLRA